MTSPTDMPRHKPRIALTPGDPAGIGPELLARLLAEPANRARARILIVADRAEIDEGMRIAGREFPYRAIADSATLTEDDDVPALLECEEDWPRPFVRAAVSADAGRYAIATLERAVRLTRAGHADAVCFAPLNKGAMHAAGLAHPDETHWFAELLEARGSVGELNVLDRLWTSRVTSHVALRDVADLVTPDRIVRAIRLLHTALVQSGVSAPRIAVCGLNPHNGDNGSFGREEIDVIEPAIAAAIAEGLPAEGPYPADTIFLKRDSVDAIVTMYHDQGQIAMKLMGFWRGVTIHGGLPIPIGTPAHGTAFDIYGRGQANPGAMQAAFDLLCRMAARRRERR
jgi:4-hydroxythreonine-4-phosphate dehydrogenase